MSAFTESIVEEAALPWFEALGYAVMNGAEIERDLGEVVLEGRLREALGRLNPEVAADGIGGERERHHLEHVWSAPDLQARATALEVNDSAVAVLGDESLRYIARELVETVKRNVTIDWAVKDSVRAKLRVAVKRILRKYGYPPDKAEVATSTVIEQAELLSEGWA